jgi:hypothetical protein
MRSTMRAAMASSRSSGATGGTSTRPRSASQDPTSCETCSWLSPNVRGIRGFISTEKGTRPMSAATYSAFVPRQT